MAVRSAPPASPPAIMVAEGTHPSYQWRQYFVITDRRCVMVEMTPALWGGWRYHRVTVQGEDAWPCDAESIVAWKLNSNDPPSMCTLPASDLATLLAIASMGYIKRCSSCSDVLTESLLGQNEPERCKRCP